MVKLANLKLEKTMKHLTLFIILIFSATLSYAKVNPQTKLKSLKRGYILAGDFNRNEVRFNTDIKVHEYGSIQESSFAPNCKIDTAHGLEIFSTIINKGHSYTLNSLSYNDYTKKMTIRSSNTFKFPRDIIFTCENVLTLQSTVHDFEKAFGKIITVK